MNPENGSGASIGGSDWCSSWASASCCLGVVLMLAMRAHNPDFFVGRTLARTVAPPEEQHATLPTQG